MFRFNGGNTLGREMQVYADKKMLTNIAQSTVFDRWFTINKKIPANSGTKVRFDRWVPMSLLMFTNNINEQFVEGRTEDSDLIINVPQQAWESFVLPEGSSGDEKGDMKLVQKEANIIDIGMWKSHTEEIKKYDDKWTVTEEVSQMSEVASMVIDGFHRDTLSLGATQNFDISDGTATKRVVNSSNFTAQIRKAVRSMQLQGAKPTRWIISSSPNYGTTPIKSVYSALIHTSAEEALRANPDFVAIEETGKSTEYDIYMQLIGYIGGVAVYTTPNAVLKPDEDNAGEYTCEMFIFGQDHSANIGVRGAGRVNFIVKALGENGNDPLNRIGSVGWKATIGGTVLYPERMARVVANIKL